MVIENVKATSDEIHARQRYHLALVRLAKNSRLKDPLHTMLDDQPRPIPKAISWVHIAQENHRHSNL
jgi:hypothetical protein